MLSTLVSATLGVASVATALHLPPLEERTRVHLDDLVTRGLDYPTLEQDASGCVPLFGSEEKHLSADDVRSVEELLQGHNSTGDLFRFADLETDKPTSESSEITLQGPNNCKVFPGDAAWPSSQDWNALNAITNNALLKPAPQAHVCYGSNASANSSACQALTERWNDPFAHLDDPLEMLTPLYQGMTCQPPSLFDVTGTCEQGGYPVYVVNVTNVAQVQLAVNFARNTGIRLVVKNTGHDFVGKSGGAGSLSVWTHHMKEVAFLPEYQDSDYTGPAIKSGVGIQGFELYAAADSFGVIAMGGECPTVGPMGGWVQGGGHSPVSSLWGLGADHVLGLEVVTADGKFVTANKDQHSDLFWALRGGGGGTFGIVTSVITRVFYDVPVTAASWDVAAGPNITNEAFEAGLKAYFETFPTGADNGIYSYFQVWPGESKRFIMQPYFAPNKTLEEAQAILEPWLQTMAKLNIPVNPKWETYNGFYDAYNASFPVEDVNTHGAASSARLFPRENFENETLWNTTWDVFSEGLNNGVVIIGYNIAPSYERGYSPDNSVNPAWRSAIGFLITATIVDLEESAEYQLEQRHNFTYGPMQQWRDITPGGGTYMSESDYLEPNFQWAFFGSYYPRLLQIKQRYDPYNLFYAHTGVGSEFFEVRTESGLPDQNGRLCVNENPKLYEAEGPNYEP